MNRYIPVFNKEKYVLSNFRFVVNPSAKYDELSTNPNLPVDWDTVELVAYTYKLQIICTTYTEYECPICLENELIAPKMTKCGHIFCVKCIQRHIHHRNNFSASILETIAQIIPKCPLCYSAISAKELRSCQLVPSTILKEGDVAEFHLISRKRYSNILYDEVYSGKGRKKIPPYIYSKDTIPFTRVVQIYDISPIIAKEKKELEDALWFAKSCQELANVPFYESELKEIENRQNNFTALYSHIEQSIWK